MRNAVSYSLKMVPCLGLGTVKYFIAWFISRHFVFRTAIGSVTARGRSSDLRCLYQVLRANEYPMVPLRPRPVILDAGANVGYATLLFAARYPDARIVAVEPEPSNFELLKANTSHLGCVTLVQAAIGADNRRAMIVDQATEKWACRFSHSGSAVANAAEYVDGCSVEMLMRSNGIHAWDLVKMDIEGAEADVFGGYSPWMKTIGYLMIEIHRSAWKSVFKAIDTLTYDSWLSGENVIFKFAQYPDG